MYERTKDRRRSERRSRDRRRRSPSVRPSTSLNGRRTNGRADERADGRNAKCAVGNQSGTLRRVGRKRTDGRPACTGGRCVPSSPLRATVGEIRQPPSACLPLASCLPGCSRQRCRSHIAWLPPSPPPPSPLPTFSLHCMAGRQQW